jgi:hypothetical protein
MTGGISIEDLKGIKEALEGLIMSGQLRFHNVDFDEGLFATEVSADEAEMVLSISLSKKDQTMLIGDD